jgi:hypothetical protein
MLNRYGRCGKRRPHIHRVSHTSHSDYRCCFNRERPTDSAREAKRVDEDGSRAFGQPTLPAVPA